MRLVFCLSLISLVLSYAVAEPAVEDLKLSEISEDASEHETDEVLADQIACIEGVDRNDADYPNACAAVARLAWEGAKWAGRVGAEAWVGQQIVQGAEWVANQVGDARRAAQERAEAGRAQLAEHGERAGNHIATVPIKKAVDDSQFDYQ